MSNSKNVPPNKQETATCPYCQRQFSSLDQLTLHIVTRHTHSGRSKRGPAQSGSK